MESVSLSVLCNLPLACLLMSQLNFYLRGVVYICCTYYLCLFVFCLSVYYSPHILVCYLFVIVMSVIFLNLSLSASFLLLSLL